MIDTKLIVITLIAISFIFIAAFLSPITTKKELKPLQSIIDGQISLKFIRSRLWFLPCLTGLWQGRTVEVILKQGGRSSVLFISLFNRCISPCSRIVVYPTDIITNPVILPINPDLNILNCMPGFEIPQTNMRVISNADNQEQVLQFLNPNRLKIIEDIFSHHFDYFEIQQIESSDSFIRTGCRFLNPDRRKTYAEILFHGSNSKRDLILTPKTVDYVLTKLKEF